MAQNNSSDSAISFDGFVSFRGVHTRDGLSQKVKTALQQDGFTVFDDNNHIGEAEFIKKKIKEGINKSEIHIVLLSENYADSGSCVQELEHIMNRTVLQSTVIPVFYGVNQQDVKNLTGEFGHGFFKLMELYKQKKRQSWIDQQLSESEMAKGEIALWKKENTWRNVFRKVAGVKGFVSVKTEEVGDLVNLIVESFKEIKDEQSPRGPPSWHDYVKVIGFLYIIWQFSHLLWKPQFYNLIGATCAICSVVSFCQGLYKKKALQASQGS